MNLMFLLLTCVTATEASRSSLKGIPVPGAIVLDQLLSRFLNKTDYTEAIFEYIRGNDNARKSSGNLNMAVLDRDNVRKILNTIKARFENKNFRRYDREEAYWEYPETNSIKETAMDMMKQSIYATKFRMNDTRRFRKLYADDAGFHIAMYYGALMEINTKMETLFTIIKKLKEYSHFFWFLVIYEKILAANVDAHDMVDRIFDLHFKHLRRIRGEKNLELVPTIPTPRGSTKPTRRRRRIRTRPAVVYTLPSDGWSQDDYDHHMNISDFPPDHMPTTTEDQNEDQGNSTAKPSEDSNSTVVDDVDATVADEPNTESTILPAETTAGTAEETSPKTTENSPEISPPGPPSGEPGGGPDEPGDGPGGPGDGPGGPGGGPGDYPPRKRRGPDNDNTRRARGEPEEYDYEYEYDYVL